MSRGFAIIRSGIAEHMLAGRLSFFDLGLYVTIHLQADFATGKWIGSAPRLLAASPRGISLRDAQRGLQNLRRIGFLKPFHKHGERGNYRVLIDKYFVRIGALKGKRLNAWASESWENPVYESCALTDALSDALSDAEAAPSSVFSSQKSGNKRKAPAQAPPPPDPRFQPFFDYAFQGFVSGFAVRPSWGEKDGAALKELLKKLPGVPLEDLRQRWDNYLGSTEEFTAKQSGSLSYFCSRADQFIRGPILPPSNGAKGGNRAEQRTRDNLRAAGFVQ